MDRDPFSYPGTELTALAGAHHYYEWILLSFRPYLGNRILEVGSGVGRFAELLLNATHPDHLTLVEPAVRRGSTGNSREYPRFGELASLANFEYHEAAYADYPAVGDVARYFP
jgi:hypothetical protein